MAPAGRLVAFCLCAAVAFAGVALGAESQREVFLEPDPEARDRESQGASGNLVLVTALVSALGAGGALAILSRRHWRIRLGGGIVGGLATYVTLALGQSSSPNYTVAIEARMATLSNTLFAANMEAVPSLLVPVLALVLAGVLVLGWSGRRLLGHRRGPEAEDPLVLLRAQAAATALATPFLALAAWGNLRLLFELPSDRPGLGPYFVVLPAVTLACLTLAGIGAAKAWALGTYVRNSRLADSVQEAWGTLGRIETALLACLGALALAGTFLEAERLQALELGLTFGSTLRGHTQMLLFLAIPLAPALLLQRRIAHRLAQAPAHAATLESGTHQLAYLTAGASIAAIVLAALGTWGTEAALWPWVLASLPCVALAARCGPVRGAAPMLLLAFLLWAIGNTVVATYDGNREAFLVFRSSQGLLAFYRTLGAVVAAAAVARLAGELGQTGLPALPLAAGVGIAGAGVALLEMPLTAWLTNRAGVDSIAVGSVLASQDPAVRATMHVVAGVLAISAAVLVALLHRPDWFGKAPRRPVAFVRPKATRTGRSATGKTPA